MNHLERILKKNGEDAISPVIGIMLMLVVTVIIAAVVSGFSGDLMGSKSAKTPTIGMDVKIKNTGLYASSVFEATVTSVSDPIPTKDLKLVTSWTNNAGVTGGASVTGSTNIVGWTAGGFPATGGVAPWGAGPGVSEMNTGVPSKPGQQFGKYTLLGGTVMYAYPAGQSGGVMSIPGTSGYGLTTQGSYTADWTGTDGMQAVLGSGWQTLLPGNTVNVKMVYVPTSTAIFDKDVVVS
nr:type IV pilin [uncultured Methanoregula sp.]